MGNDYDAASAADSQKGGIPRVHGCLSRMVEQHAVLAAFRLRFGELQEQIGKTMRAVAIEEEENHEPFGAVLSFMEKLGILDSELVKNSAAQPDGCVARYSLPRLSP